MSRLCKKNLIHVGDGITSTDPDSPEHVRFLDDYLRHENSHYTNYVSVCSTACVEILVHDFR